MGDVMPRIRKLIAMAFALIPLALVFTASAARAEKRLALVVGNSGYQVGALATPANDAGLVAQTLQAAGFDVVGARDLDQDSLRRAFRDFLDKATAAGADTVAFIYVSGYGVQLEGENYFVPVDAKIARDADVAAEAIRLSDYIRPLAALKLKSSIVVLDAARANPFAKSGPPLAGGLALVEPEPGVLIAFNAAPGTVAPEGQGPYGPYAQALAEMMRGGGLPVAGGFGRTGGGEAGAADARSWRARRLCRGVGTRHVAGLLGFSRRLSRRSDGRTSACHCCRPARGDHVAAHPRRRHAARLLVVSAALSGRAARGRCAPAPGVSCRRLRAAAVVCGHRL